MTELDSSVYGRWLTDGAESHYAAFLVEDGALAAMCTHVGDWFRPLTAWVPVTAAAPAECGRCWQIFAARHIKKGSRP